MTTSDLIATASVAVAAISALIAAITTGVAIYATRKVTQVAINVDGRLSQLLALTAKSSRAEGVEQQRKEDNSNEQV